MKIFVAFPTKGRGIDTLKEIIENADRPNEILFSVAMDLDDEKGVEEMTEYLHSIADTTKYILDVKPPSTKIDAINRACWHFSNNRTYEIMCQFSDDMKGWATGWDSIIMADMEQYFPNFDGMLWYDWDNQPEYFSKRLGKQVTRGTSLHENMCINIAPIVGRKLYNKILDQNSGQFYWHEYKAYYCDEELMSYIQQKVGTRYAQFVNHRLAGHAHHCWLGGQPFDATYQKWDDKGIFAHDKRVFDRRCAQLGLRGRHQ